MVCACACSVAKLCPTLWDPVDCSPPGSPVYGILQTRILKYATIPFSRGSFRQRNWTQVSGVAGGFSTFGDTRLVLGAELACVPGRTAGDPSLFMGFLRDKTSCWHWPLGFFQGRNQSWVKLSQYHVWQVCWEEGTMAALLVLREIGMSALTWSMARILR